MPNTCDYERNGAGPKLATEIQRLVARLRLVSKRYLCASVLSTDVIFTSAPIWFKCSLFQRSLKPKIERRLCLEI